MAYKRSRTAADVESRHVHRPIQRAISTVEWRDVERATGGTSAFALTIFRDHVVSFLAPARPTYMPRDGFDQRLYANQLASLRGVCHQWQLLVQSLLDAVPHRLITVDLSESSLDQAIAKAERDGAGASAEELTFNMLSEYEYNFHATVDYPALCQPVQWDALFTRYPNVIRLDVQLLPMRCMPTVLASAARHLNAVQALVVYDGELDDSIQDADRNRVIQAITDAMQEWHRLNGGLRLVSLPFWMGFDDAVHQRFKQAVVSYCPRIEILRGDTANHPIDSGNEARLLEEEDEEIVNGDPIVSDNVWTAFCHSCTQLREYSSYLTCFTPKAFQIFRTSPKPVLDSIDVCIRNQQEWTRETLEQLAIAYPQLRSLRVAVRVDTTITPSFAIALAGLLEAVGSHCHSLQELALQCSQETGLVICNELLQRVLHKCPALRDLKIEAVEAIETTAVDTVEALVRHHSKPINVDLYVATSPHASAYRLLTYLAERVDTLRPMHVRLWTNLYIQRRKSLIRSALKLPVNINELRQLYQVILTGPIPTRIIVGVLRFFVNGSAVYMVSFVNFWRDPTSKGALPSKFNVFDFIYD